MAESIINRLFRCPAIWNYIKLLSKIFLQSVFKYLVIPLVDFGSKVVNSLYSAKSGFSIKA